MEINLLSRYPQTKRDVAARGAIKTTHDKTIARLFDEDFFDGERKYGYGGFTYDPKFWTGVIDDFISHYNLNKNSKILDVGCAKGFMLYDFILAVPGIDITGVDVSIYAIQHCIQEIKDHLYIRDAANGLSYFKDNEFDLVVSINTVHNLEIEGCKKSIQEIERIGKNKFITVDAWRNQQEKEAMLNWNLTAQTFMHVDEWKSMFQSIGYTGDYYWFVP